jgi:hypothetical protein
MKRKSFWLIIVSTLFLTLNLPLSIHASDEYIIKGKIVNVAEKRKQSEIKKDSFIQLIPIKPDNSVALNFKDGIFLGYVSELPKVLIPENGIFTFKLKNITPGRYAIAAQKLQDKLGSLGSKFLVDTKNNKNVDFVIENKPNAQKIFDLGNIKIP